MLRSIGKKLDEFLVVLCYGLLDKPSTQTAVERPGSTWPQCTADLVWLLNADKLILGELECLLD